RRGGPQAMTTDSLPGPKRFPKAALILGWLLLLLGLLHWLFQPLPAWGLSQASLSQASPSQASPSQAGLPQEPQVAALASPAQLAEGGRLFANTCAGCHLNGGNIVRRDRTLKLKALQRRGIDGPEAIARIAAQGIGRMDGYAKVLGPDGPEKVGAWVWKQALENWPRSS
ncbi:MAG: c-type cytochrome, partial [Cyanobacteriota bacterium]